MASETTRTRGCSGCLIEAIELHDERRLHNLLSASNVEYSDDYWVPREKLIQFMTPFPNCKRRFPMLTSNSLNSQHQCAHPVIEETLVPGEPENIALSVVLVSMLHTTAQFNAFQIVIESRKLDMKEPLIFHLRIKRNWSFFIVDPVGMALLLEKGTDIDDPPNYLLLLKPFGRICSKNLERDLQAIEVYAYTRNWRVHREKSLFSFLYSLGCSGSLFGGISSLQSAWLLARLKAISRMGLCLYSRIILFRSVNTF